MHITLSTYGKLIKYNILSNESVDIKSDGLYYGTIQINDVIYTIFRENCEVTSNNYIKIIGLDGTSTVKLDSIHTHEMIKSMDEKTIYWISTYNGKLYYTFDLFNTVNSFKIGTNRHHINTIAIKDDFLYALCHNKGPSDVMIFDIKSFNKVNIYANIGIKCHNICFYKNGFLYLESEEGYLSYFDESNKRIDRLFSFSFLNKSVFLKGLLLVNEYAFIGVNEWGNRSFRCQYNAQLACYDLINNRLSWIQNLQTNGIINSINYTDGHHYIQNICKIEKLPRPRFNFSLIETKNRHKKHSKDMINHLTYIPIETLKKDINIGLWDDYKYPFLNHFQPEFRNDMSCIAIFCNGDCTKFYKTNVYYKMKDTIEYIIQYIFGEDSMDNIAKFQIALLRSSEEVKTHVDGQKWSNIYNRIHVCIDTNNKVEYLFPKHLDGYKSIEEGEVVEFNNKIPHSVRNNGDSDRINIIIDYSREKIPHYIDIDENHPIML